MAFELCQRGVDVRAVAKSAYDETAGTILIRPAKGGNKVVQPLADLPHLQAMIKEMRPRSL
jgi:hypothetical protein